MMQRYITIYVHPQQVRTTRITLNDLANIWINVKTYTKYNPVITYLYNSILIIIVLISSSLKRFCVIFA